MLMPKRGPAGGGFVPGGGGALLEVSLTEIPTDGDIAAMPLVVLTIAVKL
jgi:hypothetical protein